MGGGYGAEHTEINWTTHVWMLNASSANAQVNQNYIIMCVHSHDEMTLMYDYHWKRARHECPFCNAIVPKKAQI